MKLMSLLLGSVVALTITGTQAAERADVYAQVNLGLMYQNDRGVPQETAEAVKRYRKASEQGYADAQFNLGLAYANGEGVPQDYGEAAKFYRKAAEQGYAEAQSNLGILYYNGRGVPQDYGEAVKWYRRAGLCRGAVQPRHHECHRQGRAEGLRCRAYVVQSCRRGREPESAGRPGFRRKPDNPQTTRQGPTHGPRMDGAASVGVACPSYPPPRYRRLHQLPAALASPRRSDGGVRH